MRNLYISTALILALLITVPPQTALAQEDGTITIGLIPEINIFEQMKRFKALAKYLSQKTGVEVKLTVLSKYGDIIESFRDRKVDGAFFGSFTGALGITLLELQPLARPIYPGGESTYRGFIFVRKDSGIRGVKEMKGRRIAFVDRATSAGYLFPVAYFKEHGVGDFKSFFSSYFFSGSHDAAIYAVLDKNADIGAAKNTVFDRLRRKDPRVDDELLVISRSVSFPSNGLLVRKAMDEGLKLALKLALINISSDARGRRALKDFGALGFIETTGRDYKVVFDMAQGAGIDFKTYDYRNE